MVHLTIDVVDPGNTVDENGRLGECDLEEDIRFKIKMFQIFIEVETMAYMNKFQLYELINHLNQKIYRSSVILQSLC